MIYYIAEKKDKNNNSTEKAPYDIEVVCKKLGYKELVFSPKNTEGTVKKLSNIIECAFDWICTLLKLKAGDILIYQYPMACMPLSVKAIPLLKKKGVKLIALIHDLNSVRYALGGYSAKKLDFYKRCDMKLKEFDVVICHNDSMKKLLHKSGMVEDLQKIVTLEVFDYLYSGDLKDRKRDNTVAIAGNLSSSKARYIYEPKDIRLNLFGINCEKNLSDNIRYFGSYDANDLPGAMEGDFGLVWDGDEADTCSGSYGEYLRYNNPHKLSLYVASNMPVIIWRQAACAVLVEKYKIGFSVDSLNEISEVIGNMTDSEYQTIKENVIKFGDKLRSGYHTEKAIKAGLELLGV